MSGFGRPKEYKSRISFIFNIEADLLDGLKQISLREHRSVTSILHEQIKVYVKAHGHANDSFKLTDWNKDSGMVALPTLGSTPIMDELRKLSVEDLKLIQRKGDHWRHACETALSEKGQVKGFDY